ncbi:NAD(P)-dependent alcohol dehydrogenase [Actinophytocola sp.]|uniref:NAD(P)-dependent alcohol dehydrogenase n=1 Tax=Actinophytocola sp. TaxID=1872138 RepID=UPI002ED29A5A
MLVRVRAAGVDQGTWHQVTGLPYLGRLAFGLPRPRMPVPGLDMAGIVEAVGTKVTGFRPGDEVFGIGRGTFAEYTTAKRIVPKPANLTFEQAAAVPVSACTALEVLRGVEAGQRVLVIGAGGGVGSYAVQLATVFGASVTGVCGPTKVEFVRSLGATEVIDYTSTELSGQYDRVLDIAGSRPLPTLLRLLTPRGTLVLVGAEEGGRWIGGLSRSFGVLVRRPFTRQHLRAPLSIVRTSDLTRLSELLTEGRITPAVDQTLPLIDVPTAITHLRNSRVRGKIVITP